MTKPTRFLVRMAIFLAIVAIAAVALYPQVAAAFLANPGLNGLIVGVMLVGVVYAFRQVATLNGEVAWVEALRRRRPGLVPPTSQPRLLATVAAALGGQEGPVRLSALSMRSLLDGISARLDESGEILRYFTGLLIFLGLLGTFWGLLETVSSIADVIGGLQLGNGNMGTVFENLKAGLQAPLGGMGTAFSSSLFGLAGALVLGFLDLQAGQAKNRFFNELEEWMSSVTRHGVSAAPMAAIEGEQAVPAYIQALLEQTAESLEGLQKIVARAEEGRVAANRNLQSLAERLATLTEQMRAEQNLLVRLAEQQIDMQPLLARLADSADRPALDSASRDHIANIDLYLARLIEDLQAGRGELVQDVRSEIKLLARTLAALQGQNPPPPAPERR